MLTEFNARIAARLIAGRIADEVFGLDPPSIRAVIVIVVHVPVARRIFQRVCVIWAYLCHYQRFLCLPAGNNWQFRPCVCVCAVSAESQRPLRPPLSLGPRSAPSLPSRTAGKTSGSWVGRPLGHLLPYAQFSASRLEVGSARVRAPRPCRRSTKRRGRGFDLTDQLLVRQPFARGLRECASEAAAVIGFAVVVPESLLVQIPEQMETARR